MDASKEHEPPETIAAFLDERLTYLRTHGLGDDRVRTHSLRLLRILCRAANHRRMPREMRGRYERLLKALRPHIMKLQSSGHAVPAVVLSEIQRVRFESLPRRPA